MAYSDKQREFSINISGLLQKCGEYQKIMSMIKNNNCKRLQMSWIYLH
jgi:hypothetical protein